MKKENKNLTLLWVTCKNHFMGRIPPDDDQQCADRFNSDIYTSALDHMATVCEKPERLDKASNHAQNLIGEGKTALDPRGTPRCRATGEREISYLQAASFSSSTDTRPEMAINQMQGYPIGNSRVRLSWGGVGTPYRPAPPPPRRWTGRSSSSGQVKKGKGKKRKRKGLMIPFSIMEREG
ncbi:Uu.00g129160.m01.CDS01 [Anthostomella pinea]|uniref:Uu.00g129160.m01.CDS01 n=1 Tax=Anthostomella pinea TaxID=933095 RepID=A0AAI8YI64_9PEZI|nr:Uu.00g129160.m01.CDS01 [Anthostomella pinea]